MFYEFGKVSIYIGPDDSRLIARESLPVEQEQSSVQEKISSHRRLASSLRENLSLRCRLPVGWGRFGNTFEVYGFGYVVELSVDEEEDGEEAGDLWWKEKDER